MTEDPAFSIGGSPIFKCIISVLVQLLAETKTDLKLSFSPGLCLTLIKSYSHLKIGLAPVLSAGS